MQPNPDPDLNEKLSGAVAAREIIEDCCQQALQGLQKSLSEGNKTRMTYWIERSGLLLNEWHEIEKTIFELQAAAEEAADRLNTELNNRNDTYDSK